MVARRFALWFGGALLIQMASLAIAAPGFIGSSRVSTAESGEPADADIHVRFNCKTQYLRHEPLGGGDRLRVFLEPSSICNGVSPTVARSKTRLRPFNSDNAHLLELEYDGESAAGSVLTLIFSEPVEFDIDMAALSFELVVHVRPEAGQSSGKAETGRESDILHRQVLQAPIATVNWVINLASLRRTPTLADALDLQLEDGQRLFYKEVVIDGIAWYRLRFGDFASADAANRALAALTATFPGAWIDREDGDAVSTTIATSKQTTQTEDVAEGVSAGSRIDVLMEDARKTMIAGDTSRAVQIYTKILQLPEHPRQAEAQEYLALAREKKGQTAHAKAEYERYLSLYPDSEGANRVRQRLAALLSSGRQSGATGSSPAAGNSRAAQRSDWRIQTFFSQYYRRDANQQNDQQEIISQSALYSDINFDARRRGDRFDFSSRLSAGYRNDFLDSTTSSGNSTRISYAYADLADAVTGLRGRIGRQSRNTGGVLGRFDGLNLGYELNERILVNAVAGKPAYSSSDSIDDERTFYGASLNYGPVFDGLDLGLFFIEQNIEGIQDRRAVGGELRYFGTNRNLWAQIDYDLGFGELASAFLQGSWRFDSRLSIHALVDRRGNPFLSAGNAMIGQPVVSFTELTAIFSEHELRQLGQDRTAQSTSYTIGMSYPLSPKLQINADMTQSTTDGTPASGGVLDTPATSYNYYSGSIVASSLLKEGDVSIITVRYSNSDTSRVASLSFDSRFPFGKSWRINPRLRVDRRERLGNSGYEWLYTPGFRLQYRRSQKFRIDLETGKQFSQQEIQGNDLDRESHFINLGYQVFF